MEKKLYKQIFNQIDISEQSSEKIRQMLIAEQAQHNQRKMKFRKLPRLAVVFAAVLIIATVGVSAGYIFNLGDAFQSFYSMIFDSSIRLTDTQKRSIEQNAAVLGQTFDYKGVNLTFEAAFGDSSSVYIPCAVKLDNEYSQSILASARNPRFYVGEEVNEFGLSCKLPLNVYSKVDSDNNEVNFQSGYILESRNHILKNNIVTAVITDKDSYLDTGVDLKKALKKSNLAQGDYICDENAVSDIFIPNKQLNIKLDNVYGETTLQAVGVKDNIMVIALQIKGYFENFVQLKLRNKQTGEIISRCDSSTGRYLIKEKLAGMSFDISKDTDISHYELVIMSEFAIELPMDYTINEIELCNEKSKTVADMEINSAVVSALSIVVKGTAPVDDVSELLQCFSLRLSDNTIINYGDASGASYDDNGAFTQTLAFRKPIDIADMEVLLVQRNGVKIEIPIN